MHLMVSAQACGSREAAKPRTDRILITRQPYQPIGSSMMAYAVSCILLTFPCAYALRCMHRQLLDAGGVTSESNRHTVQTA